MELSKVIVGVDLGATYVRAGLLTLDGRVLDLQQRPLEAEKGPQTGIRRTIELIESLLVKQPGLSLQGIGVGATGPVDPQKGTIQNPYTLPSWQYVPFTEPLANHFGVPAVLENDADVAALGEYWQGAGQGVKRLAAVTVGTGIGTAFILDGHIYRGLNGVHPEAGHHIVDPSGPQCYCGAHGCWESLASGQALNVYARKQAEINPGWLEKMGLESAAQVDGASVASAARSGDTLALAIMEREARYLALGMLNVILFFVPEVIVLSGGVIKSYDLLGDRIRATMEQHKLMVPADQVKILPAKLGYYAGVTGAAFALISSLA